MLLFGLLCELRLFPIAAVCLPLPFALPSDRPPAPLLLLLVLPTVGTALATDEEEVAEVADGVIPAEADEEAAELIDGEVAAVAANKAAEAFDGE